MIYIDLYVVVVSAAMGQLYIFWHRRPQYAWDYISGRLFQRDIIFKKRLEANKMIIIINMKEIVLFLKN